MATYGGAVDLIVTELARGDTSITVVIEREFLKAIEYYGAERFWFNEARSSFTASNTNYYALATVFPATATYDTGFTEIDQVTVTVNGGVVELLPETFQELNRMDVSGFTGPPSRYAIYGEQMRIYPKPASGTTYQIDVAGTRRLATLSASTESNAWTKEALNMIAARTEKVISARKFKDYEAAQMYEVAEQQEYDRLQDRTSRYIGTGKIKAGY